MTSPNGLAPLLNAVYTSTAEGETILKRLSRDAGFSADNVVSRLGIARSLSDPPETWDAQIEADTGGKQIRGFTLLGRQEVAAALVAMLIEAEGRALSVDEVRRLVRLHWERGLRLIHGDANDGDMEALLVSYAEQALLSDGVSAAKAALSPETVLSSVIVGQAALKRDLSKLLRQAASHDPPRLAKPLVILGPEGSGKSVVGKAVATALQLPFVHLPAEQMETAESILELLEQQLAVQGYSGRRSGREGTAYPPCVIYLGQAEQLTAEQRALLQCLQPRQKSSTLGSRPVRITGGALLVSASDGWLDGRHYRLFLGPYSRDEVAEILRREIGGWPLEMRRFLALAGRLNPERAITFGREFLSLARSRPGGGRPSEGFLLETMRNRWGIDRLGLSDLDYEFLSSLVSEESAPLESKDGTEFLQRLGFVETKNESVTITRRGEQAYQAWRGGRSG